jgi:hypothetical protein
VHLNDSHANTTDAIMSCFWLFTLTVHWIKPETSEVGKYNYKILGWNEKRNVMIKPEDPARRQIHVPRLSLSNENCMLAEIYRDSRGSGWTRLIQIHDFVVPKKKNKIKYCRKDQIKYFQSEWIYRVGR